MAKAFDLSSILEEKKSTIKLGNEVYEISDGFNDLLKIDALSNRRDELGDMEFIKEFLQIALGEENATKLIERNYKIKVYTAIIDCIQKTYGDDEQEGASSEEGTSMV